VYCLGPIGHTHHVKRVALPAPSGALYLNTGTWADLIRVPPAVFDGDEPTARSQFDAFFDDLKSNKADRIRRLLPTFAKIDFDKDGAITHKDVQFFDGPDSVVSVDTAGILRRLA
jgi:hypothetical protein